MAKRPTLKHIAAINRAMEYNMHLMKHERTQPTIIRLATEDYAVLLNLKFLLCDYRENKTLFE